MNALLLAVVADAIVVSSATHEIVRSERAPSSVHLAARELAHFTRLAVVAAPTPGKDHLFVGANPHSAAAGILPQDLKPEGFRIRALGRDIHIVGDDSTGDPEQIRRTRPTRCGTLFGVYEFLERFAGITFAWHDELGTVVPPLQELRVELPLDDVQSPAWATRTIINTPPGSTGAIYGRRLRLGASVETDYTHNWFRILPPTKYGATHPEYFALVRGQRRIATSATNHAGQVCTTHPDVVDLFAQAAIDHFNRNPGDRVFAISPNDGKGFCECAGCRALDPPWDGDVPNLTDRILTFYNAVAEKVVRVHPSKRLGGFVYASYQHAPSRVKPHAALALAHATNSAWAQGVRDEREREDERAWVSLSHDLTKYDIYYYGDYGSMNLPAPVTTHLVEKLRREHELGFGGAYLYAAPSYELLGAGHYLMARLMWDPRADVVALEKRFYDALYGPAGADVLAYYRLLESRLRKARTEGVDRKEPILLRTLSWVGTDSDSAAVTIAAYGSILDAAADLLSRAGERPLSTLEQKRLARLRDHHDLLTGTVRAMLAAGRIEAQERIQAEDLNRFREGLAQRESARARIRTYAPAFAAQLDGDDGERMGLISAKGALARLAREGAAPPVFVAASSPDHGRFDDLAPSDLPAKLRIVTSGDARVDLATKSLRISVPSGGAATLKLEGDVKPGGLHRLSLLHRSVGARPRYDHTREAPLLRLHPATADRTVPFLSLGVPAVEDAKEWTPFGSVFQVPPGVTRLRMTLTYSLPGEFELDDVVFETLP